MKTIIFLFLLSFFQSSVFGINLTEVKIENICKGQLFFNFIGYVKLSDNEYYIKGRLLDKNTDTDIWFRENFKQPFSDIQYTLINGLKIKGIDIHTKEKKMFLVLEDTRGRCFSIQQQKTADMDMAFFYGNLLIKDSSYSIYEGKTINIDEVKHLITDINENSVMIKNLESNVTFEVTLAKKAKA